MRGREVPGADSDGAAACGEEGWREGISIGRVWVEVDAAAGGSRGGLVVGGGEVWERMAGVASSMSRRKRRMMQVASGLAAVHASWRGEREPLVQQRSSVGKGYEGTKVGR